MNMQAFHDFANIASAFVPKNMKAQFMTLVMETASQGEAFQQGIRDEVTQLHSKLDTLLARIPELSHVKETETTVEPIEDKLDAIESEVLEISENVSRETSEDGEDV